MRYRGFFQRFYLSEYKTSKMPRSEIDSKIEKIIVLYVVSDAKFPDFVYVRGKRVKLASFNRHSQISDKEQRTSFGIFFSDRNFGKY